ncbi:hypothetical protein FACS1894172_09360 [Spirochaetia bacterium]|nr:hypothetical protein FACS1894172_09360 [Spirochaetia bacterium]
MTLKTFVNKWYGKKCDFDGYYGAQCVDLFRQYNKDVFNLPHTGGVSGAIELYTQYDSLPVEKQYYDRIPSCGAAIPGDVVVFGATPGNKYGHVAIVLEVYETFMLVLEQDGFAQDGAKINVRNYDRVAGYLRRKS